MSKVLEVQLKLQLVTKVGMGAALRQCRAWSQGGVNCGGVCVCVHITVT